MPDVKETINIQGATLFKWLGQLLTSTSNPLQMLKFISISRILIMNISHENKSDETAFLLMPKLDDPELTELNEILLSQIAKGISADKIEEIVKIYSTNIEENDIKSALFDLFNSFDIDLEKTQ